MNSDNYILRLFCILVLFPACIGLSGQERDTVRLGLAEALEIGRQQSLDSKENSNNLRIAYWQYRNYKAGLYPNISLEGTLPSLNRSLSSYQQSDGVYKFIRNNYITEDLAINVTQAIPFTGGTLRLQSSVQRMDQLGQSNVGSFLSVPFALSWEQPLLAYNPYKWDRKIEPVRYEKSRLQYVADMENVNITTVTCYFDFLMSASRKEIAVQNLETARKLHSIALEKADMGILSKDELMHLNVSMLNAEAALIDAEHDYSEKMHSLRNYLGLDDTVEIVPQLPPAKNLENINIGLVWDKAFANNPLYKDFKVRLLEAEENMVKAKRERLPDISLNVAIGSTGSDQKFFRSYADLQNLQVANIGLSIPILDWGKRKGNYELARSQYALVEDRVAREENDFRESVRTLITDISDQPRLLELYHSADSIAQERYRIALEQFTLGDIGVIDINYAEQEKDAARQNYISQLYISWLLYYNLRYVTLYDFDNGCDLVFDEETVKLR